MCFKKLVKSIDNLTAAINKKSHHHFVITIGPFREKETILMPDLALNLGDNQEFTYGPVTAADAAGNPVPLAGPLSVTVDDATIVAITPDTTDPTKGVISATGKLGSCKVTLTDTVETENILIAVAVEGEAGLALNLGAPVEKAPPAP